MLFIKNIILCLGMLLAVNMEYSAAFDDREQDEQSVIVVHDYKDTKQKIIEEEGLLTKGEILFKYTYGTIASNIPSNCVGIRVDPTKVLVHNSAFLDTLFPSDRPLDEKDYTESGMLLSNYISRQLLAAFRKEGLKPDEVLIYHPLTACPMVVSIHEWITDTKTWNSSYGLWNRKWRSDHYLYPPVITIKGPIQPDKLIFPYEKRFGHNAGSPTGTHPTTCRKYCTSSRNLRSILRLLR